MKLNNRGFMMAELVVVSAIVLAFLTSLYLSYNKLYSAYSTRLDYYDTGALYRLGFYSDYLISQNRFNTLISQSVTNEVVEISEIASDKYNEKVFLIFNDYKNLSANVLNNRSVNSTYGTYVKYLSTAVNLTNTNYVMIIERCNKSNLDDCKYAYLEVSDEE